jgi:hypothetical protein
MLTNNTIRTPYKVGKTLTRTLQQVQRQTQHGSEPRSGHVVLLVKPHLHRDQLKNNNNQVCFL